MFGQNFTRAGFGALLFGLLIGLIVIVVGFAVLGWLARRKGL